jgi:hypothetical protein
MSEHTPGPWTAFALPDRDGFCTHQIHWSPDGECVTDGVYGEANALLIAAAPDLLSALRTLLAESEDWAEVLNGERPSLLDAIDAARSAIAKAEGRHHA